MVQKIDLMFHLVKNTQSIFYEGGDEKKTASEGKVSAYRFAKLSDCNVPADGLRIGGKVHRSVGKLHERDGGGNQGNEQERAEWKTKTTEQLTCVCFGRWVGLNPDAEHSLIAFCKCSLDEGGAGAF